MLCKAMVLVYFEGTISVYTCIMLECQFQSQRTQHAKHEHYKYQHWHRYYKTFQLK
jgi:hypothetical protein